MKNTEQQNSTAPANCGNTMLYAGLPIEEPYFDKNGKQINQFALLKIYHFTGARRKRYYMYKWVKLKQSSGKYYYAGLHLYDDTESSYFLRSTANSERVLVDAEIVQQPSILEINLNSSSKIGHSPLDSYARF